MIISLTEAKNHLRVDNTDDDDLIVRLVGAAQKEAERATWRKLTYGTEYVYMDSFNTNDGDYIRVPKPPLQSVTSIQYYDTDNNLQTFSSDDYEVDTQTEPGRIALVSGSSWPSIYSRMNAVIITYIAGYEETDDIPDNIILGMLQCIGHWFENRESVIVGTNAIPLPQSAETLWQSESVKHYWKGLSV